jgi:hypothetical protein
MVCVRKVRKVLMKADSAAARLTLARMGCLVDSLGVLERDVSAKQAGDTVSDPWVASQSQKFRVVRRHVDPIQRHTAIAAALEDGAQLLHFAKRQDTVHHQPPLVAVKSDLRIAERHLW